MGCTIGIETFWMETLSARDMLASGVSVSQFAASLAASELMILRLTSSATLAELTLTESSSTSRKVLLRLERKAALLNEATSDSKRNCTPRMER